MSSETITTALFLISAVIAAGVLINAVYPVVYNMAGTFSSSTHESDVRMRTDFKIISTVAYTSGTATIWMKNIGSEQIAYDEIKRSDVFCGEVGKFDRIAYTSHRGLEINGVRSELGELMGNGRCRDYWGGGGSNAPHHCGICSRGKHPLCC